MIMPGIRQDSSCLRRVTAGKYDTFLVMEVAQDEISVMGTSDFTRQAQAQQHVTPDGFGSDFHERRRAWMHPHVIPKVKR